MKKNLELNEIAAEIKDMLNDVVNPITKSIEIEDDIEKAEHMEDTKGCDCEGCMECKASGGCDMEMCKGHKEIAKSEELTDEDVSKNYISDDEHLDKWNNMEKACWSGYKQVGMKDKNGRQVPNCVPVNKSTGEPEEPKPSWGFFSGNK